MPLWRSNWLPRPDVSTHPLQVKDWEAAAAADSGTVYPGTEAFARQFGKGVPLGAPLLVLRLEDEGLVVGLGD